MKTLNNVYAIMQYIRKDNKEKEFEFQCSIKNEAFYIRKRRIGSTNRHRYEKTENEYFPQIHEEFLKYVVKKCNYF